MAPSSLQEPQQYQFWQIETAQRTGEGVFSVEPGCYGAMWISAPQFLASYNAFSVTIEPAAAAEALPATGNRQQILISIPPASSSMLS